MKGTIFFGTALLLMCTFTGTGCAAERTVVYDPAYDRAAVVTDTGADHIVVVRRRPPAPRREVRPPRPSSRHVWVPGHWAWSNGTYVWERGHWARVPRTDAVWVPGHWKRYRGGWVWIPGHWRY